MDRRTLEITQLGLVPYKDGLDLMDSARHAVLAGSVPDQLFVLEHPPVVTAGRNARVEKHLLATPEGLREHGIAFHRTGRGGDVTYHGPGQVVAYPVVNLHPDRRDVRRFVRDLEEAVLRTLAGLGVTAGRIPGLTGVWVGDLKIAAIGVRISRWVTTHGLAFNVATDLRPYDHIVPCGIRHRGVTSLSRVLEREVAVREVRDVLARELAEVLDRDAVCRTAPPPSLSWNAPAAREVLS